jgi:hypothetical protein
MPRHPEGEQVTDQTPYNYPPPAPAPRPRRRRRYLGWVVVGVIAVAWFASSVTDSDTGTVTTVHTPAAAKPAEPTYDTPRIADFELTVKELARRRFGSAGDYVDYRVNLSKLPGHTYDPAKEYELTYSITGGEDGPETQTMTIHGDKYEPYEGHISTRDGVKVKATPTSIEEV